MCRGEEGDKNVGYISFCLFFPQNMPNIVLRLWLIVPHCLEISGGGE